ncbi:MAG: (2Fe-2S)-binding protein [Pseudomonadota bacterium]|nr:(2Fe-2S)-binding protein [Pseudomonadota bacterium]
MIICICHAISDHQIRAAVRDGASSLRDITRVLKVGTCCGKCVPEARAALDRSVAQRPEAALRYFPRATGFAI